MMTDDDKARLAELRDGYEKNGNWGPLISTYPELLALAGRLAGEVAQANQDYAGMLRLHDSALDEIETLKAERDRLQQVAEAARAHLAGEIWAWWRLSDALRDVDTGEGQ